MTLNYAMSVQAFRMRDCELFDAVKTIGAFKLAHRNAMPMETAVIRLRRCNSRIDELLAEGEYRRFARHEAITA